MNNAFYPDDNYAALSLCGSTDDVWCLWKYCEFVILLSTECPEEETRSLFDQLQANKELKEREIEDDFKLSE
jgi:hypothetical protein